MLMLFCLPILADPIATTNDATNIDETTVTLNGQLSNLTEVNSTVYFYYKTTNAASYTKTSIQVLTDNTTYLVNLTDLTANTPYTYLASVTNANLSTEFNATSSKTFTTLKTQNERDVETGVTNTQTIMYAAFGLLALMVLVGAAVAIYTMFNGGTDATSMMYIATASIGGAIILAVGIVIIGLVAQSIIG